MLVELSVRNLAIFDDVRVPFPPGLNIVTGETGAGKSILVEAIRLALGEKADPMAVKAGEAGGEGSARFALPRAGGPEGDGGGGGLPGGRGVGAPARHSRRGAQPGLLQRPDGLAVRPRGPVAAARGAGGAGKRHPPACAGGRAVGGGRVFGDRDGGVGDAPPLPADIRP